MIHGDVLGQRARLSPASTALVEVASGNRYSYAELDHCAAALANGWRNGLNLEPGDRVGVLAGNRVELLDCFFAAGKSGLIVVPLNAKLTAHELAGIISDCGMAALHFDDEHAQTVQELRTMIEVPHWIAFDDAGPADEHHSQLLETPSSALPPVDPEHPYCLLYTSGTTGTPKGVVIPHRQVAFNAYNTAVCWQLGETDVSPIFTPLYHAGGLGAFLLPLLAAGGTVILHRCFDAAEVWQTIKKEHCTVVLGVPTIWKLLAEAPEFASADLAHVRWFISGGAPLPHSLIELYRDRGVVLRQGYGLTEVGVNCFAMSNDEAWSKAGSIGRPLMFTEAVLMDEHGSEVATGEVGELCFRGPHVCSGYWNNPDATAAAIDADGWFHTGDMARCDDDGFFYIAGRSKDMFISGGVNVFPVQIENELLQHPDIADAAVAGVPHPTWGEVGVAFVVAAPGRQVDEAGLAAFLEQRLARFKVPRHYVVVSELPRTAYGKVVKGELVDRYLGEHTETETTRENA